MGSQCLFVRSDEPRWGSIFGRCKERCLVLFYRRKRSTSAPVLFLLPMSTAMFCIFLFFKTYCLLLNIAKNFSCVKLNGCCCCWWWWAFLLVLFTENRLAGISAKLAVVFRKKRLIVLLLISLPFYSFFMFAEYYFIFKPFSAKNRLFWLTLICCCRSFLLLPLPFSIISILVGYV